MKNKNLELESELEECREELKKWQIKDAVRVFKHMESLNGDFGEYINNADEDDIKHIQCCCDAFMERRYKTTKRGRENDLMLLKPIEKEFVKVMDPDVSITEKREILSKPQVGQGIFTLLASTVLPALISLFTK